MILYYKVKKDNQTINSILKQNLNISSRLFSKLINNKLVKVNNQICDTRNYVHINDIISIDFSYTEDNSNIVPTKMNLNIIYEDEAFIVLNKPAGIAVHPSFSHFDNTLSNGVKFYFESIGLKRKIRPVNRLDLNTSGLIVFSKNEYIQECLIQQMNSHIFKKDYLAIVVGHFDEPQGTINLPIARKENSIIERCISENGQEAITDYKVLKEFKIGSNCFSVVECSLKTGRTHQIRVHMSAIGHPLLGDTLYGLPSYLINRQALHSYKISYIHPITNKTLELTCELPNDMKNLPIF